MGYAAISLALLGFAAGVVFRLQVLLSILALLFLVSILFSLGRGFNFLDTALTMAPKLNSGYGKWGSVSSPRPPGTVISWLAARYRGPGIWPDSMALRITTSSLGLAVAAPMQDVKPMSR